MTIVTNKFTDAIIAIAIKTEIVNNDLHVLTKTGDDFIILGGTESICIFENVETPDTVKEQEYKYTTAGGFVKNEDYVPYVSPEERVSALENQTAEYMVDLDFRLSNIELGL